ncbi:MAG: LysR family transcriptional regulator [Pseudomonadota bacterium]
MHRNNFGDIRVFVEVARRGGFRAAADRLQQAPASVSEAVQRLENRLGVRLFERSTRSVSLTQIGHRFYQRSLPAVMDLEGALSALNEEKDQVSGTLRLSAPYSAGPFFLDALLARFAVAYPSVAIEILYEDTKVDLLTSGIDAAIRSSTMMAPDSHAVPIGPELKMTIVASLAYLEERGTPKGPPDILEHDTICYAFGRGDRLAPWGFTGPDGSYVIQPKPRLVTNDMRSLLHYAAQGLGLAYVYREIAAPVMAETELVGVLAEHLSPLPRYSINYQSKRHMTRRLRAFLDFAKGSRDAQ